MREEMEEIFKWRFKEWAYSAGERADFKGPWHEWLLTQCVRGTEKSQGSRRMVGREENGSVWEFGKRCVMSSFAGYVQEFVFHSKPVWAIANFKNNEPGLFFRIVTSAGYWTKNELL